MLPPTLSKKKRGGGTIAREIPLGSKYSASLSRIMCRQRYLWSECQRGERDIHHPPMQLPLVVSTPENYEIQYRYPLAETSHDLWLGKSQQFAVRVHLWLEHVTQSHTQRCDAPHCAFIWGTLEISRCLSIRGIRPQNCEMFSVLTAVF